MAGIIDGERPPRPAHPAFTSELWELMQRCWDRDPELRPKASEVLEVLAGLLVPHHLLQIQVLSLTLLASRDSSPSSNPLQRLHRLERSSPQFPNQLASILAGDEYRDYVSVLRGEGLVWLVDYLDGVRLDVTIPRSFL